MGYKKSFNLVTLQLIIPLSTMTKAEYKNVYGIDLDDIDIEKVTLLQDEGSKNKYFVDEVKTTESGIDIYAGGKILSIGSSVSVTENAYSVGNAKPVYYHPIYITDNVDVSLRFSLVILDNKSTAYTKAELRTKLIELMELGGLININGFVVDNSIQQAVYLLQKIADNNYSIIWYTPGTADTRGRTDFITVFDNSNVSVYDGVNKIN